MQIHQGHRDAPLRSTHPFWVRATQELDVRAHRCVGSIEACKATWCRCAACRVLPCDLSCKNIECSSSSFLQACAAVHPKNDRRLSHTVHECANQQRESRKENAEPKQGQRRGAPRALGSLPLRDFQTSGSSFAVPRAQTLCAGLCF